MQKSVLNASHSLTIKVHTTYWVMANDYLHYLLVKQTNNFTHAPNSCYFSSNYRILIYFNQTSINHTINTPIKHNQHHRIKNQSIMLQCPLVA